MDSSVMVYCSFSVSNDWDPRGIRYFSIKVDRASAFVLSIRGRERPAGTIIIVLN